MEYSNPKDTCLLHYLWNCWTNFLSFFLSSYFTSIMQPVGLCQALSIFTVHGLTRLYTLSFIHFYLAASIRECDSWALPSWVYPSSFHLPGRFSVPNFNSLSLALSRLPIPVVLKNFGNGATAFPPPSTPANHVLSTWGCHLTPLFSSSRTSFLLCLLHLRHWIYRCSTVCFATLHHQHSGALISPVLVKTFSTAPCPILSW